MRMRNCGGFRLPRVVPEDPTARQRALQLLGNMTQRKLRSSTVAELSALLCESDLNREKAQELKGALEREARMDRRKAANECNCSFSKKIEDAVALPESDARLSRAFVLLEQYRRSDGLCSDSIEKQLRDIAGMGPRTLREAHVMRRKLVLKAAARRSWERRPPFLQGKDIPKHDLILLKDLLGAAAIGQSLGRRRSALLEFTDGHWPRTTKVARKWKACVAALLRKEVSKEKKMERQREVEQKRKMRAKKRLLREADFAITRFESPTSESFMTG